MITQIDFDTAVVEAQSFFAETMAEFQQAYMEGREYAGQSAAPPDAEEGQVGFEDDQEVF